MSQGPGQGPKPSQAAAVVAEVVKEAACRKLTGTATVVLSFNQGGLTSASYGIQDKHRKPA